VHSHRYCRMRHGEGHLKKKFQLDQTDSIEDKTLASLGRLSIAIGLAICHRGINLNKSFRPIGLKAKKIDFAKPVDTEHCHQNSHLRNGAGHSETSFRPIGLTALKINAVKSEHWHQASSKSHYAHTWKKVSGRSD